MASCDYVLMLLDDLDTNKTNKKKNLLVESGLTGWMTVVDLAAFSPAKWAGGIYSTTLIPTNEPGPKDWASMVIKLTKVSKWY